jgi:hypothetical protein
VKFTRFHVRPLAGFSPTNGELLENRRRVSLIGFPAVILLSLLPAYARAQAVAEGFVELKPDRPPIHVLVYQVWGGVCPEGCTDGDVFVGDFAISVLLESGKRVTTPLNSMMGGGTLRFPVGRWGLWHLVFDDYNDDGRPDFALAELSCGNNDGYYLFTISESGRVKLLPQASGGAIGMQGDTVSTRIPTSPEGLVATIYNNATGKGETVIYRWNRSRSVFELVGRNIGVPPMLDIPAP